MKGWFVLLLVFAVLSPFSASAQNNGVSVGYGFGLLNPHQAFGKVEEERRYDFGHLAYFHQWQLVRGLYFLAEPFLAYNSNPESKWDVGLNTFLRYYVQTSRNTSLFGNIGAGVAHTGVDFKEQGTHYLFSLAGGIGFKWDRFFIENRFRHYSNAGLATPNTSVHANIIMVGVFF
jgi:Lipid A 3-O-deacylase (PagL)